MLIPNWASKSCQKAIIFQVANGLIFFNPDAAAFYWQNFSKGLLQPYGIDAWWQDATEPENDDLYNRRINNGKVPGEVHRNVYPIYVNKNRL